MRVNQIDVVCTIMKHLDRNGIKHANARQNNAIIEAANLIVAAFDEEHRPAGEGIGIGAWLRSDETGLSSRFMARVLGPKIGVYVPVPEEGIHYHGMHHPHDPADFGRCLGLLKAEPKLREHIGEMANHGKEWKALVENWAELEALYVEEFPTGKAPKCYERMTQLLRAV